MSTEPRHDPSGDMMVIKNSSLFTLLLMLIFSPACKKKEPPSKNIVNFDKLYSITSKYDDKTSLLFIDIKLDDKLHAYAQGEKIGKPVSLEISPKNGWLPNEPARIPQGTVKKLALGYSIVLEGSIRLSQSLIQGRGPGE